jgi:hypothetical protein
MALTVLLLLRVRRSGSVVTAMGAGLAVGAAVLTRANLAPFALFVPLWLAFFGGPNSAPWRRRLWMAIICATVFALTVSPWLVRAYQLTRTVTLSTQTGFFLWLGNNPYTFSHYPRESIDRSQVAALAGLSLQDRSDLEARSYNEATVDQWFWDKGLAYIREHPWQTVGQGFRKVWDAFGWLPSPRRSFWPSLVHFMSFGTIMCLGIWGMWVSRKRWQECSIFYAQFAGFIAVTAIFFGATSYRAYLDVYWIVFASGVLAALAGKYLHNRTATIMQPHSKAK